MTRAEAEADALLTKHGARFEEPEQRVALRKAIAEYSLRQHQPVIVAEEREKA